MFRRPPEFKIDPDLDNPFHADKLGREEPIRNLTKLMQGTNTPMVMTVSAPWGSGKSSFIKMWKAFLMEDEGGDHPCILFDAWKHDFHKEPLLSFMGELGAYMSSIENPKSQLTEQFERCLNAAPPLLNAVGALSSLAAAADSRLTPVATFMAALGNTAGKVKKYILKDYALQKSSIDNFTDELEAFVKMLLAGRKGECLYFFIDELDRCDPEYAIKLLESIKHFFHIPGIVFVLSVDRDKLGSMVRVRYGENYDANGYLKRFVDVDYQIKEPEREKFISYLCEDVLELNQYPIGKTKERLADVVQTALTLANDYRMPARDIEKVFLKLSPHLREDFSEMDSEIFIQRGSKLFWNRGGALAPISAGVFSKLQNYFYPLLILAFVKEVAPAHYARFGEVYAGSSSTAEGQLRDLRKSRPQSLYGQNVISELQLKLLPSKLTNKQDDYRKRFPNDTFLADLLFASCLLSLNEGFWGKKEVEIRSNLDSLDNITFLSAEDSSDDSDAA